MKIEFNSDNKVKSDFDYPKLYLDYGEKSRIVCIETSPEVQFVHNLRAPEIINGEVVMEKVKAKSGEIVDKPKYGFVGRHLCFGNPETLMKSLKDPANCPTCAAADKYDFIDKAQRRFAMHVVQYKTKPDTFKIQTPFQAELVVWAFTDRVFDTLTDIMEEHGDLRSRDLLLGPCDNKKFQNFDIQVGGSAEWAANAESQEFVKRLYAENRVEDLVPIISRKATREQAEEDIQKVLIKNQQAFGGGDGGSAGVAGLGSGQSMDLDNLLGGGSPEPAAEAPKEEVAAPAETGGFAFGSDESVKSTGEPEPEATPEPEASAPAAEEPKEEKKTLDFDSLLGDLS